MQYTQAQEALVAHLAKKLAIFYRMLPGWITPVLARQEAAVAKETDVTTTMNAISTTMLEATSNLAENLAQSEPFLRFKAAVESMRVARRVSRGNNPWTLGAEDQNEARPRRVPFGHR